MLRPSLVLSTALALAAASAPAAAQVEGAREAAETITAADIAHRIGVLAHDSMRGRATPSPELDQAAAWIASQFEGMGLEPAGDDGGYLQRYAIRALAADLDSSTVRSSNGSATSFVEGALPLRFSAPSPVIARGPVVLVTGAPGETLEGTELGGRHVVFVGPERSAFTVARAAAGAGAASFLLASGPRDASWSDRVEEARGRVRSVVGEPSAGMPALELHDEALGDLLGMDVAALRARGGAARVRELPGLSFTVQQQTRVESEEWAPNVVAVLPGSDPALRDEYVAFSAHMDHVGVGTPDASGDSIYNGADDDASGTATVIEVAEAMASLPERPRRSTLFLLVSGEERGLWGSAWFAANPTVPLGEVVAALNADMVGRNWSDTIVAIGRQHSDLGETLARVNGAHPELGMTAIDDLWPEENFYRRSDHFNFARRGVPILFFFNGTHDDYHRPSDEPEAIDADKTARIGRLLFWLGLDVAQSDRRPEWVPESYRSIVEGGGG